MSKFYTYKREYIKKSGEISVINQKIPKKTIKERILLEKTKDNGKYYYKYKLIYDDGTEEIKNIKRTYKKVDKTNKQEIIKGKLMLNVINENDKIIYKYKIVYDDGTETILTTNEQKKR